MATLVGTVENHGKMVQKTRHTCENRKHHGEITSAANLLKLKVSNFRKKSKKYIF